jgi:beta-N-acetylhexosaminidase
VYVRSLPPAHVKHAARALSAAGAAALAVGAVTGGCGGGRAGEDDRSRVTAGAKRATTARPRRPARSAATHDRQDPVRLAGSVVLLRFTGPRAPAYVLRALRGGRAAGVTLFADNVVSPAQVRALTATLQRAAGGDALIATDQEGGSVRQVPFAASPTAPPSLASPAAAEAAGRATAHDLRSLGINVNLAPVADLADGRVARGRAFGGEPGAVARLVAATVRGARAGGVAPTAKHFPGLAGAEQNTDDASVTIDRPSAPGLRPFRAAAQAGVPLVMVGHAVYPGIDPGHIASQSPAVLRLLRRRVGFTGVAVTDSLEAEAVVSRSPVDVAALRSLRAGVDLLLTTGQGSHLRILRRLATAIAASQPVRERADQAARRVAALRARLARGG